MSALLRRVDGRSSEVCRVCEGGAVFCIGGGPSLTREQCEKVELWRAADERRRVIAINNAYLWAPFADVCYFADAEWWEWHHAGTPIPSLGLSAADVAERFASFAGQKCTIDQSAPRVKDTAVHVLKSDRKSPLSRDPQAISRGGHGGYQALNIAALSGAPLVVLLGYDARDPEKGKASHWFGEHPRVAPIAVHRKYRESFAMMDTLLKERGVRVVNCSPDTAITTFEKMPLEEALAARAELAA